MSSSEASNRGKALRSRVSRESHAKWKAPHSRTDPLSILEASDEGRVADLIPIRYGRMLRSPFAFYRGSAAVMASDLVHTPSTGVRVQSCGDAHLANFGGFATPERNIVFDINDFDETLPAPWEWDLKRLVTSFVLAMRENGIGDDDAVNVARKCVRRYREGMRDFAKMHPLDLWYLHFGVSALVERIDDPHLRRRILKRVEKVSSERGSDVLYPKLTTVVDGKVRIAENPPLIFHPEAAMAPDFKAGVERVMAEYRETLAEDRRLLLDRFHFVDAAMKVVGVGSVGTRCWVVLLMSSSGEPLFLQFKQARRSALEPFAGKSAYAHSGQRIVMGQRLMQASSDIFLGWTTGPQGDFHVRQLRDTKIKLLIEAADLLTFEAYADACGWDLARAHAKSGSAATIGAYLGKGDVFDDAVAEFATSYADQAQSDHASFARAVRSGRIDAIVE